MSAVLLNQIAEKQKALELSELAFKAAQNIVPVEELNKAIAAWESSKVDHQQAVAYVTDDLTELLENAYTEQGLRWRLDCLNKSLGSLRPGDFGFIFARPETGKTTFLASEGSYMASQSNERGLGIVCWFNNEEQGSKVMLRVYQAFFGVTMEQLMANPKRYRDAFLEQTQGRFRLYDSATIGRKDVERVVDELNPVLVVYDQIDKIKGFQNDREDLRLGAIYQWAREMAKGRHAAIGVCQADGHAEGQRYLTMEHVANAKTSKQAEADFILGIGKTHDPGQEYIRHLNISKNKLIGDSDSVPELRHARFDVLIEPAIARYKDIVNYG